MTRFVPFEISYKTAERLSQVNTILFYLSGALSIAIIIVGHSEIDKNQILKWLNGSNCFLAIIYFAIDLVSGYLFQAAELKRRHDFIDNSLATQLSEANSANYFSNDNILPGIRKLGINCFENSFFSKNIAGKMLLGETVKTAIIWSLALVAVLTTDNETVAAILQMALPFTVLQQMIKLITYYHRINRVFEQFQHIFSSTASERQSDLIINNVINYESTISWAGIVLSTPIFQKHNVEWSQLWDKIKAKYNLTQ
ncbi:MAG: hypothetical protein SFW35_02945 [Chitinophagales bacterium]|nr:hypothetical protein [Chitinophagales bacterium]